MKYLWLLTTETDNGIVFFDIYPDKDTAVAHCDTVKDIDPSRWVSDVSGDMKALPTESWHYTYRLTQEPFHTRL